MKNGGGDSEIVKMDFELFGYIYTFLELGEKKSSKFQDSLFSHCGGFLDPNYLTISKVDILY
jgi:hypothetical protein